MINTLYIMVGASGSGKSTLAKKLKKLFEETYDVSSDDMREILWGNANNQQNPKKVFNECEIDIIGYADKNVNVIFDATNLYKKYRKRWVELGKQHFDKVVAIWCNTSKAKCIVNQDKRERQVPTSIVERQWDGLEPPRLDEGFDEVWIVTEDVGLKNIRIIKKTY